MKQHDAKLFVMCHHGICRSASLAYFFLRFAGLGSQSAETKIKNARATARVIRAYRESGEKYLQHME